MAKKKEKIKKDQSDKVMKIFISNPKTGYNYKQISKILGDDGSKFKQYLPSILKSLSKQNEIIESTPGKYKLHPSMSNKLKKTGHFITGKVDMKQTGKAYIITDDLLDDVKISPNNVNTALHGDKVKVFLFPKRKSQKTEGEIVEILERNTLQFSGIIEKSKKFAFVIADKKSMPVDIYIPEHQINEAKNGQKVIAEITDWPKNAKNPFGKIIDIIGYPGDNEVEISSILFDKNISVNFPENVVQDLNSISKDIKSTDIKQRDDFRDVLTITIDPADAKDFDDALSFRKISEDIYEIGVHIADVSHYVGSDTPLDQEAYKRATSVYLVDRVIPMLPEELSNVICSLNPGNDRLTFSVIFNIMKSGRVTKRRFCKSIIRSDKRFNYDEVQNVLDKKSGEYYDELNIINTIAQNLRNKRIKNGSILFDKKEVGFNLDSNGKPLSVFFREHKDAHKLIEEFMLLANKSVAEKIGKQEKNKKDKVFVYRVHDIPNPEKLSTLTEFVSKFGYKIKTGSRKNISNSFNNLLKQVEGKGEQNIIETLTIRTMAKAEYSTENIGHYGLSFDYYTHFTSPIRRYPDLMVHRLLYSYLTNNKTEYNKNDYESMCEHCSEQERVAQEAEYSSIKYKQAEYLSDKIGQTFDAIISGVSKWGLFVEIKDNKCEGLIHMKSLADDFYYLDEDNFQVIGNNKGKKYKLGDPILVKISKVDIIKKQIDLILE